MTNCNTPNWASFTSLAQRGNESLPVTSPHELPEVIDLKAVAEFFAVDLHTAYRLAEAHKIKAFKFGGQWRFYTKDLYDPFILPNTKCPLCGQLVPDAH